MPVRLTSLALILISLWAASASADLIRQEVGQLQRDSGEVRVIDGGFRHHASGFRFPLSLGKMPARKSVTYGPGDADVSYSLRGGGNNDAWLSLIVYPASSSLADEVANIEGSMSQKWSMDRAATPVGLVAPPGGAVEGWFSSTLKGEKFLNGYRLIRAGAWFIQARVTVPEAGGSEALARATNAIDAVQWNWQPQGDAIRAGG